jgi:MtN3 and saliva related transmembrane protein
MATVHVHIPYLVAVAAPVINCIQLLPQLYKTLTTKHVRDLSFPSLCLILTTSLLWTAHGYFIEDPSLIYAGAISVAINACLFALYLFYRR